MIELLIVTKSKDVNGNNYSFAARMDITREELEKIIFSSSMFPIRWDSGVAYISTDDLAICRISEVEDISNQLVEPILDNLEE